MKLGVLTSGGDAPGMNAAIRSCVRVAKERGHEVIGYIGGYRGLLDNEFIHLERRSVSNIIQRGGTFLRTARADRFQEEEGLQLAASHLEKEGVDTLLVIGGDGSFRGCLALSHYFKGQLLGIPGTIDNDLFGTEDTIGFDTAVNTAVFAVDKIRDTADAHERFFVVEVMGRTSGHIALHVAIGSGAEGVFLPEVPTDYQHISKRLLEGKNAGKTSSLLIVAEGAKEGNAYKIANTLETLSGAPYRVVVLGHLLRGGAPTSYDRILATKLGAFAVLSAEKGEHLKMVGQEKEQLCLTSLEEAVSIKKPLCSYLQKLHPLLSS